MKDTLQTILLFAAGIIVVVLTAAAYLVMTALAIALGVAPFFLAWKLLCWLF